MNKFQAYFMGPFMLSQKTNGNPSSDFIYFSNIPLTNNIKSSINNSELFKKENPELHINELNSNNFRSDSFKSDHEGLHILFSGCSYTYGFGMAYDKIWSKIVYDQIKTTNTTSGYFNIGSSGASIMESISLIFKYCKTYKNPDVIFLNMPGFRRFYSLNNKDVIKFSFLHKTSNKVLILLAYHYYLMLDLYCKSNNIKLYSFTWTISADIDDRDSGIQESGIAKFDTYYEYKLSDVDNFVKQYMYENEGSKLLAADELHLGNPYHEYWANFIYKKYLEKNK
jgi:hypothetical protein